MNNKKIKALDLCGSGPPRRHGSDRLWASSGHGDGRLSADSAPVLAGRRRAAGAGGGRRRGARGLRLPTDQVSEADEYGAVVVVGTPVYLGLAYSLSFSVFELQSGFLFQSVFYRQLLFIIHLYHYR